MKSERRHELQYNELDQKLSSVLAWAKKNANYISWGVLLIAVVFAVSVLLYKSHKNKVDAREADFANAKAVVDPDARVEKFKAIAAEQGGDKLITAEATLAVADEYAARILTGLGKMKDDDLKQLNENSAKYYNMAADNFADNPVVVTKAHIGLAKLAEDRPDFDEAAKQYTLALDACPKGNPLMAQIKASQENLPQLRTPVALATTRPATQPASAPASAPATVPAGKTK